MTEIAIFRKRNDKKIILKFMTSFPRDSQMKTVLEDNQYGEVTVLLRVKVD